MFYGLAVKAKRSKPSHYYVLALLNHVITILQKEILPLSVLHNVNTKKLHTFWPRWNANALQAKWPEGLMALLAQFQSMAGQVQQHCKVKK